MDNVFFVRIFIFLGINEIMNNSIVIFLIILFYYCVILLLNIFFIMIIIIDENLYEFMYILLCSFCINGFYGIIGFYFKFFIDVLFFF